MNSNETRQLDDHEVDQVNGGVLTFAIGLATLYIAVYALGYQAGKDRAERENRADDNE